jgi:REP element-mobilizing transposase RayT
MDKNRQSIRLKNYDYSQSGLYFITICTENRECLLGDIVDGKMVLNNIGNMIKKWWNKIPERFDTVELDKFQIMPNHIHGVIQIIVGAGFIPARNKRVTTMVGATTRVAPTVGDIIGAFKSLTTHEYVMGVKNNGWKPFDKRLWQRNYYEHIIRNKIDLNKIREYISNNSSIWNRDRNNLLYN